MRSRYSYCKASTSKTWTQSSALQGVDCFRRLGGVCALGSCATIHMGEPALSTPKEEKPAGVCAGLSLSKFHVLNRSTGTRDSDGGCVATMGSAPRAICA